jgi:hypothetical protein
MNLFQDDLNLEFSRIKESLAKGESLKEEDLRIILLAHLLEEDTNERK